MLRLLVIGILLLRLTPAGSESVEAAIAMIADGNALPDHAPLDAEHGCTTLQHHCGCHSTVGLVGGAVLVSTPPIVATKSEFVLSTPLLEPDARDLLRPPTA